MAYKGYGGFTFGCDPELFVFDASGKPVPAMMIPGTKAEPYAVEGGAVQRDGMAAEFNINPSTEYKEFSDNIDKVLRAMQKMLPKGYTLEARASVTFDPDVFEATDDEAKALGCSPDFNAWTGEVNPPPADPENPTMRCAAGHLHIGWTEGAAPDDIQHIMNCRDLVKQFDWYLGAWSLLQDKDKIRRRLYGKAGACRFKPYGVEYRVLSNFWVLDKIQRENVWNRMQIAIQQMNGLFLPERLNGKFNAAIIDAINTSSLPSTLVSRYAFPLLTVSI